jgi:hypothetical protein
VAGPQANGPRQETRSGGRDRKRWLQDECQRGKRLTACVFTASRMVFRDLRRACSLEARGDARARLLAVTSFVASRRECTPQLDSVANSRVRERISTRTTAMGGEWLQLPISRRPSIRRHTARTRRATAPSTFCSGVSHQHQHRWRTQRLKGSVRRPMSSRIWSALREGCRRQTKPGSSGSRPR